MKQIIKTILKTILIIFVAFYILDILIMNIYCQLNDVCTEHAVSGQWIWYSY